LSSARLPPTISTTSSTGFPGIIRAQRQNWSDAFFARIDRLAIPGLSHIGRPGLMEGTRELMETPYVIVYMVDETADEIAVLAIVHGARDRERKT
jgi:plasmid stabilization system protein ParE